MLAAGLQLIAAGYLPANPADGGSSPYTSGLDSTFAVNTLFVSEWQLIWPNATPGLSLLDAIGAYVVSLAWDHGGMAGATVGGRSVICTATFSQANAIKVEVWDGMDGSSFGSLPCGIHFRIEKRL